MKTRTILKNITYFTKDAEKSANFFIDIFGLKLIHLNSNYSELVDNNNNKIVFLKVNNDSFTRTAYNPLLTFSIFNFDEVIKRLDNYNDIEFDGEVQDNQIGKYCVIKTPEGIMCTLFESKNSDLEEDINVDINEESRLDPNSSEIRNILDKLKL